MRFRVSLLLVVALLPAVALNVHSALQQRRWMTAEMEASLLRLAHGVAHHQAQVTTSAHELLTSLSMVPAVRAADPAECPHLLADVLRRVPHYTSLSVIGADGELRCRGLQPGRPARVEGLAVESAYQRAMATGEFAIGSYGIGAVTRKPVVPFALPIRDADGGVRAVLTASVHLDWLEGYVAHSDFPDGAVLTVVDGPGTVLARFPDPERWVGSQFPEDFYLRRLLATPGIREGIFRDAGLDGVARLYAYTRLPGGESSPVLVTVGTSVSAALAPANRRLTRDLVLLLLLGAAAVGIGWVIGTRAILEPVRALLRATRRVAAGDLTARASSTEHEGEIAELSSSFDRMAEALQQRTAETALSIQALQRSEQRYRCLVEASAAIVWNTPASGAFETPQPQWSEFTGQSFEELRGWGWLQAVHPEDRAGVAEAWVLAADGGWIFQVEQRLRRHDGEYRHMLVRAVPISDGGELREWVGVHTDITERKHAELERQALLAREREARAEAEEANRAKSDFLAVISHELRTPLTSIISYAELMELDGVGPLSQRQREYVTRIDASAWHLKELVDQVLEFARLEAGRISLDVKEADVRALAEECALSMTQVARMRGLAIRVASPPVPLPLHTDATKVKQILLNLLSNAVKFSTDGEVVVEVHANGRLAQLRVRDHGPGIHPDHLVRIWDRFWQAESPLTRRSEGAGLGLAVVRRLAELLGGTVGVESRLGEGSTFIVTLPRSVPKAAPPPGAAAEEPAYSRA